MSSVLLIEPLLFGADPRIEDNKFIVAAKVSEAEAQKDQHLAEELLRDERARIKRYGVQAKILRLRDEPNAEAVYGNKGDAIFPNNSISFHNFTDEEGKITRRLVILYPMSKHRRGELPRVQLLNKLEAAAKSGLIELVDLRGFESEDRCLEGTGALNFSADGRYVYMSRSGRTDDELLDIICSEENLNIPPEHRFLFASAIPRNDGSGESDTIYHTNVVGWVGKRICAWAFDLMSFANAAEEQRFRCHLSEEYDRVIDLSTEEIGTFAGNAFELATRDTAGAEKHFLCISQTALDNMSRKNRQLVGEWYGEENVLGFAGEVLERRSGGSVRCSCGFSITHGSAIPSFGEQTVFDVLKLTEQC